MKRSDRNIGRAATAVGGLAVSIGISVKAGLSLLAPSGLAALLVAVGLLSAPFFVRVLIVVGVLCSVVCAVVGLIHFGLWVKSRWIRARR